MWYSPVLGQGARRCLASNRACGIRALQYHPSGVETGDASWPGSAAWRRCNTGRANVRAAPVIIVKILSAARPSLSLVPVGITIAVVSFSPSTQCAVPPIFFGAGFPLVPHRGFDARGGFELTGTRASSKVIFFLRSTQSMHYKPQPKCKTHTVYTAKNRPFYTTT